ncbi:SGNH/GDSL hydrolase family protein [Virgibacillus byunsanensis]|uniref:SGNH/GDSL hydrolase family protein n=1 Tax=Virgibacillus byunsanensis TaxID=570945 RepID=A0ABW3LPA0_9BACI
MRIVKMLVLLLVVSLLFSTSTFAKSGNAKESLVSLGDSIPYGYNLTKNDNASTSKYAFPYLIGDDGDVRVRNLSEPGWKTEQMLSSLQSDQKFRQAVRHADYITLNIGNNDLLQALEVAQFKSGGDPVKFVDFLQEEITDSNLFGNIGEIIIETRTLTDAPIVIYNVYNPFQLDDPLHLIGSQVLPGINTQFTTIATYFNAQYGDVVLADAYLAFGQEQAKYVIPGDIHPTIEGQIKLAEIGLDALNLY